MIAVPQTIAGLRKKQDVQKNASEIGSFEEPQNTVLGELLRLGVPLESDFGKNLVMATYGLRG